MKFSELKKSLSTIKSAYLVRGSDAFLRQKATDMIVNASISIKDLNMSVFTDENTDMSAILSALKSIPMMDERRVVVLRDIAVKKADELSTLVDYLKKPLSSTVLIIIDSNGSAVYKKLESLCELVDCSPLDNVMLSKLIVSQLATTGVKINNDAAELLIQYCNGDYTRINNEVIKLGNMLNQGEVVTSQMVVDLVHREVEYDVFELSNAIGNKNGKLAMQIINNLLYKKESPLKLLMLIMSNFRRMFYAISTKESNIDIANKLGVKEYSIKIAKQVGAKFTPAQLKRILDLGASLDYKIKSGQMNEKNALIYFVTNISGM